MRHILLIIKHAASSIFDPSTGFLLKGRGQLLRSHTDWMGLFQPGLIKKTKQLYKQSSFVSKVVALHTQEAVKCFVFWQIAHARPVKTLDLFG